jgi:ferritin
MEKLISDELNAALCEQIGHEKYNANLYLFVGGFLKNKGFDNLAKKFIEQYDEENSHSKMIFDLLTDLNSPIMLPEILSVNMQFSSIVDIAKLYLEREILTTNSLDDIKKLAIIESNPVVEEFMREMIKLQRKEYEESTTFMDQAEIVGGDWKFVLLWDLGLK